jgi:hypothetical protein
LVSKTFDKRGKDHYNEPLTPVIVDGFKNFLKHDDFKSYDKEAILSLFNHYIDTDLGTFRRWKRPKTTVVDFDGMSYKVVWKVSREYYENFMQKLGTWYQEDEVMLGGCHHQAVKDLEFDITFKLKNWIANCFKFNWETHVYRSMFLKKSMKVERYNDLRSIVFAPTYFRFFEYSVYHIVHDAVKFFCESSRAGFYQFGAMKGRGVLDAVHYMMSGERSVNSVMVLYDVSSAYESVDQDLLRSMICKSFSFNPTVMNIMLLWLELTCFIDIDYDGNRIRQRIGIKMGDALSPVMFCFYLQHAIEDVVLNPKLDFIKKWAAFLDDTAFEVPIERVVEFNGEVVSSFRKFNLKVNLSKTEVVTSIINYSFYLQVFKDMGINIKRRMVYLGVKMQVMGSKVKHDEKQIDTYLTQNPTRLFLTPLQVILTYFKAKVSGKWRWAIYSLALDDEAPELSFKVMKNKFKEATGYYDVNYRDLLMWGLSPFDLFVPVVVRTSITLRRKICDVILAVSIRIIKTINSSKTLASNTKVSLVSVAQEIENMWVGTNCGDLVELSEHNGRDFILIVMIVIRGIVYGDDKWRVLKMFMKYECVYRFFKPVMYDENYLPPSRRKLRFRVLLAAYNLIRYSFDKLTNVDPVLPLNHEGAIVSLVSVFPVKLDVEEDLRNLDKQEYVELIRELIETKMEVDEGWKLSENNEVMKFKRKSIKLLKRQLLKLDILMRMSTKKEGFVLTIEDVRRVEETELEDFLIDPR